jgi:hypothetical protein
MASSICNMYDVIWKFGLTRAMVWMVSSSLGAVLTSTFVAEGKGYVPLSSLFAAFIFSRTCLMSANSFSILPRWCWASSNSLVAQSCALSVTRSASSSIMVLLALDQVLRKHWSYLTTFGTSTSWSKMEHPGVAEIVGYRLFCMLVDPARGFLGLCNGLRDVGPWVYP